MNFEITKFKSRKFLKEFFLSLLKNANKKIILKHFQNLRNEEIFTKSGPDDLVTLYDKEAEKYIINKIKSKFQNIKIIGEETSYFQKNSSVIMNNDFYITIDPIDGTKNYIKQNENFCSMISLILKKKPIAAFIYYPLKKKFISSFKEYGSEILDLEKNQSKILELNNTFNYLGTGGTKGIPENKRKSILKMFNTNFERKFVGSAGVETLLLTLNEVDFIFHGRVTPWDHSPMDIIIREAGGEVFMFNNIKEFNINSSGPILAAKNLSDWRLIKKKLI